METGYIYALVDPRNDTVKYIGQTIGALHLRRMGHYYNPASHAMRAWIDELKAVGLKPNISLLEEVSIDILGEREMYWIQTYLKDGAPLLNTFTTNEQNFPMMIRLPLKLRTDIEAFAEANNCSLAMAVRLLVEVGLRGESE